MTQIEPYIHVILTERAESWPVLAFCAIIVGMIIRGYTLRPLVRRVQDLEKKDFSEVKRHYLKRALWGWVFFALAILFAILIWRDSPLFPFSRSELLTIMCFVVSFLLSLIFHLLALGTATAIVFGQHKELFKN